MGIFWRFLSDISASRGRIHAKFYLFRDNVCQRVPSPLGSIDLWGRGRGSWKLKKMRGSRSCIGQLPFLCGSVRVRTPPRGSDGVRNKGECQFLKEFPVWFVLRYYKGAQAVGGVLRWGRPPIITLQRASSCQNPLSNTLLFQLCLSSENYLPTCQMAMVGLDYSSLQADSPPKSTAKAWIWGLAAVCCCSTSSNEPGELSQLLWWQYYHKNRPASCIIRRRRLTRLHCCAICDYVIHW